MFRGKNDRRQDEKNFVKERALAFFDDKPYCYLVKVDLRTSESRYSRRYIVETRNIVEFTSDILLPWGKQKYAIEHVIHCHVEGQDVEYQ